MRATTTLLALTLATVAVATRAEAQFYRTYEWETPVQGWAEPSLWSTWVAKSDEPYAHFGDSTTTRAGLWAHSVELEYGMSDNWSVALYADGERPAGGPFRYTRTRAEMRYKLFTRYARFMNPALYLEYYAPAGGYGPNELEGRVILEKDLNDWRLDLNPTFSKVLSGDEVSKGLELEGSSALVYRRFLLLQPSIEYYPKFGEIGRPDPLHDQRQLVFAALALRPTPGLTWLWASGAASPRGATAGR